jgi:prepilin-type N-terminal cleavage/methylation domain-containing protein
LRLRQRRGFTLAEVLVALIILAIAGAGLASTMLSINLSRHKAYMRATAIDIASTIMEENLAKSYSGLYAISGPGNSLSGYECVASSGTQVAAAAGTACPQGTTPYQWQFQVINPTPLHGIPYEQLIAQVNYSESFGLQKTVTLVNYAEYPYIQIFSDNILTSAGTNLGPMNFEGGYTGPSCRAGFPTPPTLPNKADLLYASGTITYLVNNSLQLSYNLATNITDPLGKIQSLDTIYTVAYICPVSGTPPVVSGACSQFSPVTRTPIRTQPFINEWAEVDNLYSGTYQIQIYWYTDSSAEVNAGGQATISLKVGNIIVIAVENLVTS